MEKNSLDIIKEMTSKIREAAQVFIKEDTYLETDTWKIVPVPLFKDISRLGINSTWNFAKTEEDFNKTKNDNGSIFIIVNKNDNTEQFVFFGKTGEVFEYDFTQIPRKYLVDTFSEEIVDMIDDLITAEYEGKEQIEEDTPEEVKAFNKKIEELETAISKAENKVREAKQADDEEAIKNAKMHLKFAWDDLKSFDPEHYEARVYGEEHEITESKKKWIPAKMREGALHKKLGIPEGEKIPLEVINKEIKRLQALAEGDKKLSAEDATFLKQLILARTFKKMNK